MKKPNYGKGLKLIEINSRHKEVPKRNLSSYQLGDSLASIAGSYSGKLMENRVARINKYTIRTDHNTPLSPGKSSLVGLNNSLMHRPLESSNPEKY